MFCRRIGNVDLRQIKVEDLTSYFSNFPDRSSESVDKYLLLSRFFHYWQLRGEMGAIALPTKPTRVRQSFVSYIFTSEEIRKLLASTTHTQRRANCLIDPSTFRMFLLMAYATGSSVKELLSLRRMDVNLVSRRISIHGKFSPKAREIPIGLSLRRLLAEYSRGRFSNAQSTCYLFRDKHGDAIKPSIATHNFNRLCRIAGVRRRDGVNRSPRLLDLKSTFAVHRIGAWIKQGQNLNRMLPALAAYMGQAGLGATGSYLRMTPERLKASLNLLSPNIVRTSWHGDPALLKYLNVL
jgi:integrase/recombinase XerD